MLIVVGFVFSVIMYNVRSVIKLLYVVYLFRLYEIIEWRKVVSLLVCFYC